jgi:RNA polymerase sigma-70 factor (ECF subfamily)
MRAARTRSLNYLRDNKMSFQTIDNLTIIQEDNTLELNELDELIREAVGSLPDKCGEVFRLSRNENLTNKEVSERTGLSVKSVEGHITKALKLIKAHLGKAYSFLW